MYKYRIKVEYDGAPFAGWQKQKDLLTVQGVLENAVKRLSIKDGLNPAVYCSGRTDAGVHSKGQVAHFETDRNLDNLKMKKALNFIIKEYPISILEVENLGTDSDFHARFSAKWRSYEYIILNREAPPTFEKNMIWWVSKQLNVSLMQEYCNLLVGTHDFSSFRASMCQASSPIKTIMEFTVESDGEYIRFFVKAKSFLHHQVRNMVGALVTAGIRRISIDEFVSIIKSCDRSKSGMTAPAQGLYFKEVSYT